MGISFFRSYLQALCCNSPWNYAVFWKFKPQDEMVLTWEDCFSDILKQRDAMESPIEDFHFDNSNKTLSSNLTSSQYNGTPGDYLVALAVAETSSASHVVGKGIVGEAALTRKARWIYSDSTAADVLGSASIPEYPIEWLLQFAAGVKTILLLPVMPDGVLQLGSVEMVAEDAAFVAHTKNEFDAYKETVEFDRSMSVEQFSQISTFMNTLEQPSTYTEEKVIEDQNSVHVIRIKDHNLFANQIVPVFKFQDLCNTSESVAEPCQLSCENYENDFWKYYHVEKLRTPSLCDAFGSRICGDFMNESLDFHFEEPTLEGNNFDTSFCAEESNFFSFPSDYESHNPLVEDTAYQYTFSTSVPGQDLVGSSYSMDVHESGPLGLSMNEVEVEHLLEAAISNAYSNFDDNSSDKSNVTSVNVSSGKSFAFSRNRGQSKRSASEYAGPRLDAKSDFSASVSLVESKISSLSDKQQKRKGYDCLNHEKLSRPSAANNKKRARTGDSHKPRPRDRQLIQDRIKELRELVPNSGKCSIDGLLDKTIKHMLFLRTVTNQADKLRHPILKEEVDENNMTETAEVNCSRQTGASWAVEVGSEKQLCPIVVKDLDHPGHMLIEMLCTDHGRFLEIADVIHRLQLTILKGVMGKTTDSSWARFIVETSGSFHRLDIFWPLMQLLQQSRPSP